MKMSVLQCSEVAVRRCSVKNVFLKILHISQKKMKKTLERRRSDVSDVVLVILLATFNYFRPFSSVSIVDFEQVNVTRLMLS